MLDRIDGHFKLEVFEGIVLPDFRKGFLQVGGRGVGCERLDNAVGAGLGEILLDLGEGGGVAGEESDGKIAMRGVREDTCYAGTLAVWGG